MIVANSLHCLAWRSSVLLLLPLLLFDTISSISLRFLGNFAIPCCILITILKETQQKRPLGNILIIRDVLITYLLEPLPKTFSLLNSFLSWVFYYFRCLLFFHGFCNVFGVFSYFSLGFAMCSEGVPCFPRF